MAAYFILTQTVTDLDRYYSDYVPGVMPFLAKYRAEVLAADAGAEALEGSPAEGVVVIRFPSDQAIRDFLADPDYQGLKALRFSITTDASAQLAPEFSIDTMPAPRSAKSS